MCTYSSSRIDGYQVHNHKWVSKFHILGFVHYKYHKMASRYLGGMGNKDDGNNNDDNYDDIKGRASVTMTQVLGM